MAHDQPSGLARRIARFAMLFVLSAGWCVASSALADEAKPRRVERIDGIVCGSDGSRGPTTVSARFSHSTSGAGEVTNLDDGQTIAESVLNADEAGKYRVTVPPAHVGDERLRITVTLHRDGFFDRTIGPLPVSDIAGNNIALSEPHWGERKFARAALKRAELRPVRSFTGRLLRPDGAPAMGARVEMQTYHDIEETYTEQDYTATASTTTNEDGLFKINIDRPATIHFYLKGHVPIGYADLEDHLAREAPQKTPTFQFPSGVRIHGRVLNATGEPIAGAIVQCAQNPNRICAADEHGRYDLPPVDAASRGVHLNVLTRVMRVEDIAAFNRAAEDYVPPQVATVELKEIFLTPMVPLAETDVRPEFEIRAAQTAEIRARIEFPDGRQPEDQHVPDMSVVGRIGGHQWRSAPVMADGSGIARVVVPRGLENVMVITGLARYRRTPDGPAEVGHMIALGTVNRDVDGLVVIRPRLSTLKVRLRLAEPLAREHANGKVDLGIGVYHRHEVYDLQCADPHPQGLACASYDSQICYQGKALPNEDIIVRVSKRMVDQQNKVVLFMERLQLEPGETRLREIEIADR